MQPYFSLIVVLVLAVAGASAFLLRRRVRLGAGVGPYKLEELIGEGGMGVVYRASHKHLRRPTAIKLLPPDRSSSVAVARFQREVQNTAQLSHPNTIIIFDYGRARRGAFYYAMELLVGVTLQELVQRYGKITPDRTAFILRQVCGSLQEAHDHGLVHRDVKPSNIFLCERGGLYDFVKVLDFGVAKEIDEEGNEFLTRPGALVGTPEYASPEMIRGARVDRRSDIYALGAVAYFLLVGEPAFGAENTVETLQQHIDLKPRAPSGALGALRGIVEACLSKSPGDRPQTAIEIVDRLDELGLTDWGPRQAREWWSDRSPFSVRN